MNVRIKQYLLIAILAAAGYFIMSHHIIFYGSKVLSDPGGLIWLRKKVNWNPNITTIKMNAILIALIHQRI